jgi:predicted SnoaL-like aldol condensation-catalyzing enzyme
MRTVPVTAKSADPTLRRKGALLPAIFIAAAASQSVHAETAPQRAHHDNRATVEAFVGLFYGRKDVAGAFETYVAPQYIQHNPAVGDGRDAAKAFLTPLFSNPDATFEVKRILVDGDMAAVHLKARPKKDGPSLAVMDLYRLQDGKIVEHWDVIQPMTPSGANPHPFF